MQVYSIACSLSHSDSGCTKKIIVPGTIGVVEYELMPNTPNRLKGPLPSPEELKACRHFLRNLPGRPSPRKGQKKAISMPPAFCLPWRAAEEQILFELDLDENYSGK